MKVSECLASLRICVTTSSLVQWRLPMAGLGEQSARWPEVGGGGVVNAGFNLGTSGELQPQDFSPE